MTMINKETIEGKVIVFEGLDCSFKETNAKALCKHIKEELNHEKVIMLSFPTYDDSSYFIKNYLDGAYGKSSDVDPYVAGLMYSIDRCHTMKTLNIQAKIDEGYTIIIDRYVYSNIIFQVPKFFTEEENNPMLKSIGYIEYMLNLEFEKLKLPKQDLVIYLDMPVDISSVMMKERGSKNGLKEDGHESNTKFMKKVENVGNTMLKSMLKCDIVSCVDENNNVKSKEDMFNDILKVIDKKL